ncbi:MAG: hypothetical protein M3Q97_09485, partial [Bacteroidota bacterium]|nr:hypothetical protein [Bacteroidota bacterium]
RKGPLAVELMDFLTVSQSYSYLYFAGDRIIMGDSYFYHPNDQKDRTTLAIYDIKKKKIEKEIHPPLEHIEFSRFSPHHWISACIDKILFCQISDYKITIYNHKLQKTDSITRQPEDWVRMRDEKIDYLGSVIPVSDTGLFFDSFAVYNDKLIIRLEGAWFLNDTTILARYYKYDSTVGWKSRYFDLYKIRNDKWELIKADMPDAVGKKGYRKSGHR